MIEQYEQVLTADMCGSAELGDHLRVHGDHHFLFCAHDGVPFFDLVMHPLFELSAQHYGANVNNPLLGHLREIEIVGQVIGDVGLVAGEFEYSLK